MCFLHILTLDLCIYYIYTWGCKGVKKNMNIILYIGLGLMLLGFVGFIISIIMESYYNKKLYRQKQLTESFNNADKTNERKYNDTY